MPLKFLTKNEIEAALGRLSELAASEGVRLEMTLYGGAVMLLAYDARDVTKEVDAIVHPPVIARRLVAQVAFELKLHEGWLNDDVKQFVSQKEAKNELPLKNLNREGLHITRPTAKYLLAMKVLANRKPQPGYAGDHGDIETLLRITRITTISEIQAVVDSFFPDTVLPDTSVVVLSDLLDQIAQNHATPNPQTQPAKNRKVRRSPRS